MALVFPLSLPSTPGARALKFGIVNVAGSSTGEFDLVEQVQDWQGSRWEGTITLPRMARVKAAAWCATLSALDGIVNTFLLPCYGNRYPQGSATSAVVNGAHNARVNVLNVTMSGTLVAGDYLQITEAGGYKRLHQVVSNASGSSALDIRPRLRAALVGSEAITLLNPVGTFRLAENKRVWDIDEASVVGITFNVREAL